MQETASAKSCNAGSATVHSPSPGHAEEPSIHHHSRLTRPTSAAEPSRKSCRALQPAAPAAAAAAASRDLQLCLAQPATVLPPCCGRSPAAAAAHIRHSLWLISSCSCCCCSCWSCSCACSSEHSRWDCSSCCCTTSFCTNLLFQGLISSLLLLLQQLLQPLTSDCCSTNCCCCSAAKLGSSQTQQQCLTASLGLLPDAVVPRPAQTADHCRLPLTSAPSQCPLQAVP